VVIVNGARQDGPPPGSQDQPLGAAATLPGDDREASARSFVSLIYRHILQRQPGPGELDNWSRQLLGGLTERHAIERLVASPEYLKRFHGLTPAHPAGHYYSPVVDPRELVGARAPKRAIEPGEIPGITLDVEAMRDWWRDNARIIASTPFPRTRQEGRRFFSDNNIYPIGDATILRCMMVESRPAHIVEIGSGFSTAAMLDTIDEHSLSTTITCIEPYTERLRGLMRPGDEQRVRIIEAPVQEVPLAEFASLHAGDILFIDSTHVLKTGSDVHYELFSILPSLRPGVLIHFHDIQYPFEYPDLWIFDRQYSWNEAYAVRAFLMYNKKFRIRFMAGLFYSRGQDLIAPIFPAFNEGPGSSFWIEVVQ
jgi:predicted O-methyltransferase YrrM